MISKENLEKIKESLVCLGEVVEALLACSEIKKMIPEKLDLNEVLVKMRGLAGVLDNEIGLRKEEEEKEAKDNG